MEENPNGLPVNIRAALCYLLGFITGLVFYFTDKNDDVKFHAMQSIILFGGLAVVQILLVGLSIGPLIILTGILGTLLHLASFVLWIILMVNAFQGKKMTLPMITELTEKQLRKPM